MENDSTNTNSTDVTNKSIISRTSQLLSKYSTIKNFRKTLNLTLVAVILYYVKTTNVTMDHIPQILGQFQNIIETAKNITRVTIP